MARICQSNHFMMRQHSDIIDRNIFDHVVFVDKEPIKHIMENTFDLVHIKNKVMVDDYVQLFISEEVFEKNNKIFNNERNGVNYSVVNSYDSVFSGFIRTENYFILINSDIIKQKYGIYVLIDGLSGNKYICNDIKDPIEFYGFVNIGYLIDPLGYEEYKLSRFETMNNFNIPSQIRLYLLNSSIIQHGKQLFHIDIENYNESVKIKYMRSSKSYNNSDYIKEIKNNIIKEDAIMENKIFINNMLNGFLYVGLIKKIMVPMENEANVIKSADALYILMNFMEYRGIDFSATLWEYTILNKNAKKLLDKYCDENVNKTLKEFDKMERNINIHDSGQIIHSMKYLKNI